MKFNCGETAQEKIDRLTDWHIWFAWHPIRIGSGDCRWLEKVKRKGKRTVHWDGEENYRWTYEAIQ